jgi:integrase
MIAHLSVIGKKPRTVRNTYRTLRMGLVRALDQGLIAKDISNPRLLDMPRVQHPNLLTFTREEAKLFLASTRDEPRGPLYVLALHTGLRLGECLALRWANIDMERGYLLVVESVQEVERRLIVQETKTSKSRRKIELSSTVIDALRRQKANVAKATLAAPDWTDGDLVFPNRAGSFLNGRNLLSRELRPRLKELGLPPLRFHDFRHTAASLMLLRNVPVKVVSVILGHASIQITLDYYGHLMEGQQRLGADALEALLS